jgi:hypothetical protein
LQPERFGSALRKQQARRVRVYRDEGMSGEEISGRVGVLA